MAHRPLWMGRSQKPRNNSAATTWSSVRIVTRLSQLRCESRRWLQGARSKFDPSCERSDSSVRQSGYPIRAYPPFPAKIVISSSTKNSYHVRFARKIGFVHDAVALNDGAIDRADLIWEHDQLI